MISNVLATIAICYLLSESNLLQKFRDWFPFKELIYCQICLSFWVALILTFNLLESFAIMGVMVILTKLWHILHNNNSSKR